MSAKYPTHPRTLAFALMLAAPGAAWAVPYRVFDWEGKAAPAKPTGAGQTSNTEYLNAGRYWDGVGLNTMDVTVEVTASIWNDPAKWRVDPQGFVGSGGVATYGYQSPDEAEFNFGDPAGTVIMNFDFLFSQPVNNPSFFLMDIDNNGSDHGTLFQATLQGGGIIYPHMSLVSGSTVSWTGEGPTLDVFSGGGSVNDTSNLGAALFEWNYPAVTSLSFTWESNTGTAIRMSNIYAEYDPANFLVVVPEPGTTLLVLITGAFAWRRRR